MAGTVLDEASPDEVRWYTGDEELEAGSQISLGDLSDKQRSPDDVQVVMVRHTVGGDYSGSLVERSNYEGILEDHEDHDDVFSAYGGYGSYGVVFRASSTDPELIEIMQRLENYPLYDEEHLSALEMTKSDEEWENWGRDDYVRALEKEHENVDGWDDVIEALADDPVALDALFYEVSNAESIYWEMDGPSMHINVEKVAEATSVEDIICAIVGAREKQLMEKLCGMLGLRCVHGSGPALRVLIDALWLDGFPPKTTGMGRPTRGRVEASMKRHHVGRRNVDTLAEELRDKPKMAAKYTDIAGRWVTAFWATRGAKELDEDQGARFIADALDEVLEAIGG